MLILILIDVQYLENVVFSFEKDSNDQINSTSGSHNSITPTPPSKIPPPRFPSPLTLVMDTQEAIHITCTQSKGWSLEYNSARIY